MKRHLAEEDHGPPQKRMRPTMQAGTSLNANEKPSSPFLRLPKEIRLHIYEYLLPYRGMVPSGRGPSEVYTMLRYSDSLECYPSLSLGQAGDQFARRQQLCREYSKGTWPAVLRVNRQVYGEAHDLMHTRLTFQVDILVAHRFEDKTRHHRLNVLSAQLYVRSATVIRPVCLNPYLRHLRRLSIKIWFTRKVAKNEDDDTPYIAISAKVIKDHVNNLALAMQQSPSLKAVHVELQLIRQVWPYPPPPPSVVMPPQRYLSPAFLSDQETAAAISWYLRPFKLLRNINMSCRYIAAQPSESIQRILKDIELEVESDMPVTAAKPLCALFTKFSQRTKPMLAVVKDIELGRPRGDRVLPVLHEKLWVAQDEGDLAVFRLAQGEIMAYWKEFRDKMEGDFEKTMTMANVW